MPGEFEKKLIGEVSKYVDNFVAMSIVGQFKTKKRVSNLDSMGEKFKINFVQEFLNTTLKKITTPDRMKKIHSEIIKNMFNKAGSKGELLLPEYRIYLSDVVNDPLDFAREIFGKILGETVIEMSLTQNRDDMSVKEKLMKALEIIKVIYSPFYNEARIKRLETIFIYYIKGNNIKREYNEFSMEQSKSDSKEMNQEVLKRYFEKNKERYESVKRDRDNKINVKKILGNDKGKKSLEMTVEEKVDDGKTKIDLNTKLSGSISRLVKKEKSDSGLTSNSTKYAGSIESFKHRMKQSDKASRIPGRLGSNPFGIGEKKTTSEDNFWGNFSIDEELPKYLVLYFGKTKTEEILEVVKTDFKIIQFDHASNEDLNEVFEKLINDFFWHTISQSKIAAVRSKLGKILKLKHIQ